MLSLLATHISSGTAYNWVYIIIGLIVLFGGGSIVALFRWIKRQGVRDARIDALIDPEKGILASLDHMRKRERVYERKIDDMLRSTSANGLSTDEVGDIAKRTEIAVNEIRERLFAHIGANDAEHRQLWRAINKKEEDL